MEIRKLETKIGEMINSLDGHNSGEKMKENKNCESGGQINKIYPF